MPRGFHTLLSAQFFSALADNALLIVTIALLQRSGMASWWAPLLKVGFTLSYVVLAPVVGPLADAGPKGRLMAWMNGLKIIGALALLGGLHPVLAFTVVGLGAAAYAPAKYGLVTELVQPAQLVTANGWLEVSVVSAVLLGTGLGGVLVSGPWLGWTGGLEASIVAVLGLYGLAAALNFGVPDSGARYAPAAIHPMALTRDFLAANRTLWRDLEGGLSLAVTTLLWGVGATLQFVVLRWATEVLGLTLDRAAYLQAAVAVGVIVGAAAAGRWLHLAKARRMLGLGVVLGLTLPLVACVSDVALATLLLALTGAVSGLLVVPLNALLQHRGCQLLSAGRSIAVQGYNENASILLMLAVYTGLLALQVPVAVMMWGLGLGVAAAMTGLMLRDRSRRKR
ncbi:MAG: lysophospholipid transporter LplT [Rubrivivax sp.]|nr:lysophospholipid transporter LplT [Rubrivivax sp.]